MVRKKCLTFEQQYGGYFECQCYECKKEINGYIYNGKLLSKEQLECHFKWSPVICDECHQQGILNNIKQIEKLKEIKLLQKEQYHKTRKYINRLRSRVTRCIKYNIKDIHIEELLGCSILEARAHIESQWAPWMSWDNLTIVEETNQTWNIDHIIPCTAYDPEDPIEQRICFNYRNLQPLMARDNISKGNRHNPIDKKIHDDTLKLLLFNKNNQKKTIWDVV